MHNSNIFLCLHFKQVEFVVDTVDIAELEEGNISFVRRACELGNLDIVALLLRSGASVNLIGEGVCAPIHVAARLGNTAMTAILLSNSANPNSQAKYEKKSPLHVATLEGHIEVIRLLIANGADVNSGDIYGSRPIHIACRMGRAQILNTLLENHSQINAYDNEGWTALHLAAEAGHENIVRILLGHGANIDCQSKYGRTPLHWACVSGHANIVHNLLLNGASANIRDLHEHVALYYVKNDRIKALITPHTDKSAANKKFASSIGLYLNSKTVESATISSLPGSQYDGSPALGDAKVRRWISADMLAPLSRTTSSSIDDDDNDTVDCHSARAYAKRLSGGRKMGNQAPMTIIIPPEDIAEEMMGEGLPPSSFTKRNRPSLGTSFKKMATTINGQMEELDKSVLDLDKALSKFSIAEGEEASSNKEMSLTAGLEYITKLKLINDNLKALKDTFSTDSQNIKNLINEYCSEGKALESSGPNYIALVQMLVHSIALYVGRQPAHGWKVFLLRLPISEEKSGILSFQLQMQTTLPDTEKVKQIIMHWARGCDIESKVFYMRTLLQAVQNCEFDDNSGANHVDKVLQELVNEETKFKTGK